MSNILICKGRGYQVFTTFDRVKIEQSGKLARLLIEIKGDPDLTTQKIKEIHAILTKAA